VSSSRPDIAGLVLGASLTVLLAVGWPSTLRAQPSFGLEVEAGRSVGLTPYVRNVVHARSELAGDPFPQRDSFHPYLADEPAGWGWAIGARLVTNAFHGGLTFRWLDVSTAAFRYRGVGRDGGDVRLPPTRLRTDGTVDDSGVHDYESLGAPRTIPLDEAERANLLLFELGGGYRFYLYSGAFELFIPVHAGLVLTHLTRPRAPFRPGLTTYTGVGASFDFISLMSAVFTVRGHGTVTPTYWRRSDAARRAVLLGQSTESAVFSTQVSLSFNVGLRFTIR
jgi:hypothetical protein